MRKNKVIIMVLLLLLFGLSQTFAAACGDVNSSGGVDIVDALMIAQYTVGLNPVNFNSAVANVNGDTSINVIDALMVAQYSVGSISQLSCTVATPTRTPTPTPTPTPVCTSKPAAVAVNVNFSGSAFTGSHQVAVETDPGLPQFTIFRPRDLGAGKKYPITAWGQGACSTNGLSNTEYCGQLASQGYLVIADGTPNGSGGGCGSAYSMDLKGGVCLLNAIKWAISENNNPCSQYYQSLDTTKTAAFGFSCGGIMAEGAGSMKDPVLSTFMPVSSGMTSANQTVIDSFQTPVLFLEGGSSDMAYANGKRDYNAIKAGAVPAMLVSINVGHGGTLNDDNGGLFGRVTLAWLNWWLKGDLSATGKGYLVGTTCTICKDSAWEIASKNLP